MGMLRQTAEISKAVNPGAVSVSPARLQSITAHEINSDKLETLIGMVHMRTHTLPEHIRFAAATRAGTGAPQELTLQKRFGALIPGNSSIVAVLSTVPPLKPPGSDRMLAQPRLRTDA